MKQIEAAIKSCENRIREYEAHLSKPHHHKERYAYSIELEKVKIAALQEQARREQGCEYCDFSSGSCGAIFDGEDDFFLVTPENLHEFYIATDGKGVFRETKIKFCPMCGRKLDGGGGDDTE